MGLGDWRIGVYKKKESTNFFVLAFEFINEVVDQTVVKVLTTKMGITRGGLDLKDAFLDGQEGHIKGTTAQVEDQDVALALGLLVQTVCDGGGSRLVDDTEHVEAGNEARILGRLALRVVEVGRDGDDGIFNSATQVRLGRLTHLGQDHGRDLLWGEFLGLALELDLNAGLAAPVDDLEGEVLHVGLDLGVVELAADEALGIKDSVLGVHGDLVLCGITNQTLGVGEGHEGGRGAVSLVVGDDLNAVITEEPHTGVGGSQINSYSKREASQQLLSLPENTVTGVK